MEYSDLFLSYRRKDVEFVKELDAAFKADGREVWIDWEDIPPGSTGFSDDIKRGIEGADAFVAVLSPDYLESTYCVDLELGYAVQLQKRIIPIVYRKFEGYDIPESIGGINWVYFTPHAGQANTFEEAFPRVLEAMDSDYEHSRTHTRLFLRAQEWDNNNRKNGYLLDGEGIEVAEQWIANAIDKKPPPTDLHKVYIQTSRQMRTRRLRTIITWVSVSLVFTILLAIAAIFFWIDASNQRENAEANLVLAQTSEANALNSAITATLAQGEAENNEATAVAAQSLAEQSSEQSQSLALAAAALLEYEHEDNLLAVALAMQANSIDDPTAQVQRLLQDIAYAPGVRYWLNQDGTGDILGTDGAVNLREAFDGYLLSDAVDGEIAYFPGALINNIESSTISPNGQYVVTIGDGGEHFIITNNQTGEVTLDTRSTAVNHGNVNITAFSPDSNQLISTNAEGTIWTWDLQTGDYREQLHNFAVQRIYMSVDGNIAISIGSAGVGSSQIDYLVWDTATGTELARFEESTLSRRMLGLSEDGRYMLFSELPSGYTVWDTQHGMLDTLLPIIDAVSAIEFIDDQHVRVIGVNDQAIYDITTGTQNTDAMPTETATPSLRAEVRDGQLVVVNTDGTQVLALDDARLSATGNHLFDFDGSGSRVVYLAHGLVLVRDIATGAIIADLSGLKTPLTSLTMSPDGAYVAGGYLPGSVLLWDVNSGETIREYQGDWEASYVDFSPDGERLAIAAQTTQSVGEIHPGVLSVWRLEPEAEAVEWARENRVVREFNCDERRLYNITPLCSVEDEPEQAFSSNSVASVTSTPTPTVTPTPMVQLTITEPVATFPSDGTTPTPEPATSAYNIALVGANAGTLNAGESDLWTYNGRAGEMLDLQVEGDFNALLVLRDLAGNELAASPIGTGMAQITGIILPVSGEFQIDVRGVSDEENGNYQLVVVSR